MPSALSKLPWWLIEAVVSYMVKSMAVNDQGISSHWVEWNIPISAPEWLTNIEAETKWPTFRRRHVQMHFLEWKCIDFD